MFVLGRGEGLSLFDVYCEEREEREEREEHEYHEDDG